MGNSIYASMVSHLALAASVAVIDLVLFRLICGDACISSFDLLLFLSGAEISIFAVDVKGYPLSQCFPVLPQSEFLPIQGKIQWSTPPCFLMLSCL